MQFTKSSTLMKRHCKLFFLALFSLFIGNIARCSNIDKAFHSDHKAISNNGLQASPKPSMQGKKPVKTYTAILFRMGIEGKSIEFTGNSYGGSAILGELFNIDSLNTICLKELYYASDSIHISKAFLSALSCHAPPVVSCV